MRRPSATDTLVRWAALRRKTGANSGMIWNLCFRGSANRSHLLGQGSAILHGAIRLGQQGVYFDVSYSPVRRPDGSVEAVLCIVSETTERVLAAARVRESEQRFRALVTASSDLVYRMSPDWQEMQQLDGRDFPSNVAGSTIRWKDDLVFPQD